MKINDTVARILLLLSFMALGWGLTFSWTLLVVTAIVGWFIVKDQANIFEDLRKGFKPITGCLSLIFLGLVAFRMRVNGIDLYNHIEGTDLVKFPYTFSGTSFPFLLFDMLISLFTLPGILWIFENIYSHTILSQELINRGGGTLTLPSQETSLSKKDSFLLLLASLVPLAICSQCSPLYAFNHWVDPHVYFPISNGMLHGLMPYRDLFDHKGPILYFIHAIATLVSNTSLIGVWCFEIIYSFFFLYYGLKTIWLFNKDASVWIVVLLSLITYTNASFERGDSCEELCLPLLTYTVYIAFKCTLLKRLPSCKENLAIGICLATIFWVKFTICALFLGWFLVILIIAYREKRLRSLFSIILFICLGTLAVTIPVLGFYIYNDAIEDLFNVYLLCNLKYSPHNYVYGVDVSLISSIISRLRYSFSICKDSPFICLAIITTFFSFWFSKSKRPLLAYTLQIIFPIITLVAISGYNYYSFILSAFTPIGAYVLFEHFRTKFTRPNTFILKITYVLFSIFVFYSLSENTKDISLKRKSDPHYRFAEVINSTPDATLLEYRDRIGKDPTLGGHHSYGFYTVTGIVPTCKYFALVRAFDILEQLAYQDSMVNEGAFDFLVATKGDYDLEFYSPIDSLDGYYLYKKTEKFY